MISLDLQFFAEKTEKATPHKKQEAKKKGQFAKSTDLSGAMVVTFSFVALAVFGKSMAAQLYTLFQQGFSSMMQWDVTQDSVPALFIGLLKESIPIVAPVLIVAWIAAIVGNVIQVGFVLSFASLKGGWNKINPISGIKRMFSIKSAFELLKSLLKFSVLATVAGLILWQEKQSILHTATMTPQNIVSYMFSLLVKITLILSIIYIVIAIVDFLYQRFDHDKQLRMTKQEVKEEYKQMEGDPLIKQKVKEKQRQIAMSRMMNDIKKASVVITNPTHFAVAIMYEAGEMAAPIVVAKGADYIALKIKEVAKEHHIIMMENRPLARALYANVEIGQEIPEELFKAVAEVLAYVYRMKGTLTK
ncbi:flagellar biosynthesis protein FlhB [Ectobacillus polymachus]|uniref:flagellar biosynthesis protein FlhB n=1 Tax=Ectobacillus polymachus TaxID=1508806 RepID=UPI003A8B7A9F